MNVELTRNEPCIEWYGNNGTGGNLNKSRQRQHEREQDGRDCDQVSPVLDPGAS